MKTVKQPVKLLISRGAALFLVVLFTATVAPQIANIKMASATVDGGYPWSGATALDVSQYDWGYPTCPSNDTGCYSLPYPNSSNPTDGMADTWVYNLRNCTSYAAWRINKEFTVSNITGWGNAVTWDGSDPVHHPQPYPVYNPSTYTPVYGDIAQYSSPAPYGHVAFVTGVDPNTHIASLAEYNSGFPLDSHGNPQWGLYYDGNTTASGSSGTPNRYIHIGTPSSSSIAVPVGIDFSGTLNVFTIGGDNNVYQDFWNSGTNTWNGFTSIGTGMSGSPATIVNSSAVNIFAIGTNGTVYTEYNSGSGWSGWTSMNNSQAMTGSPTIMRYGSSELDLYALGTNGTPYKDTWNGTWGGWTSMTGTLASNLSAIQYGSEMDVFGRNSSGTPYKDTWNGSGWTGWSTLSGTISGNIAAMPYSTYGEYDLWANTSGGDIFRKTWTGSGWVDWADYGGTFGGSPAATQYGNDMYVFNRASGDSTMWYKYWSYSGQTWHGWNQYSSTFKGGGDPSAYVDGTQLDVFETGNDGKVYEATYNGSTWGSFSYVP